MNFEITNLRVFIKENEVALANAKSRLETIERQCRHVWGETVKTTVSRIEMRSGAMVKHGSDFWYDSVPHTVHDPAWERICSVCGKKEITQRTEDVVEKKPVF